jgi:pimeloyl-ACP methyl ester carboxylesterase
MNLDRLQAGRFTSGDIEIAWYEAGDPEAFPVLLIHGFASTAHVNWVFPGWVKTLEQAGYRVIALDNRGHGSPTNRTIRKPTTPKPWLPTRPACSIRSMLEPRMSSAIRWAREYPHF